MTTYDSSRWDEWMRAAQGGEQSAYRLLLCELKLWLTAYFAKRVHPAAVEDLVQDTLMTLHHKKHTFDPAYPFGPWISAIARYRWIDYMRAKVRYIQTELNDDFPDQDNEHDVCAKHDVDKLLKLIPPAQAEIISMVKLREMSIEEVSRQTGHSPSSVKVMVHRGMKKMMAAVAEIKDE